MLRTAFLLATYDSICGLWSGTVGVTALTLTAGPGQMQRDCYAKGLFVGQGLGYESRAGI